jgi:hypothetical protein
VEATLAEVASHIEHIRKVAGVDHVGIGSDFDGISGTAPKGLEGVETYPALLAELARRGWSDADLAKLAGGNILRVMERAERVAAGDEERAAADRHDRGDGQAEVLEPLSPGGRGVLRRHRRSRIHLARRLRLALPLR